MRKALTYDEVALVPQFNNIESRTEPDLSTWLTRNTKINIPILPANMDSVIGSKLAKVYIKYGGIPIFHRFVDKKQKLDWIEEFEGECVISVGLNECVDDIKEYIEESPKGIIIDVAHGHDNRVLDLIKVIKDTDEYIDVIAGNVCTGLGYQDLVSAGADAVKVGIGPGAACTTRTVTGFGVPQFSAVYECGKLAEKYRVPILADGGIKTSGDIVKALAAGASTVMIGKLFACTYESAAEKKLKYLGKQLSGVTKTLCKYRGQASDDFQNEYYGEVKKGTVAEGESGWAPITGTSQELIDKLLAGIRSGMTYGGARNIKELQRKAEFVEVGPGYSLESNVRL